MIKELYNKLKIWWKERKGEVTLNDFYKDIKSWSKSDLIKYICLLAQRQNKNDAGISTQFKKELRNKSKKLLMKTLLLMKLESTKEVKRLRKKYAKKETWRNRRRIRKQMHGVSGHAEV